MVSQLRKLRFPLTIRTTCIKRDNKQNKHTQVMQKMLDWTPASVWSQKCAYLDKRVKLGHPYPQLLALYFASVCCSTVHVHRLWRCSVHYFAATFLCPFFIFGLPSISKVKFTYNLGLGLGLHINRGILR